MPPRFETFGEALKHCLDLCQRHGIPRRSVAHRAKAGLSTINSWARNDRSITHDKAKALFASLDAILKDTDDHFAVIDLMRVYGQEYPDRDAKDLLNSRHDETQVSDVSMWILHLTSSIFGLVLILVLVAMNDELAEGWQTLAGRIWSADGLSVAQLSLWCFLFTFVAIFSLGFHGEGAQNRKRWIEGGAWRDLYLSLVTFVLDRTDRWFLSEAKARRVSKTSFARSWSIELYEKCLLIAILYPLLLAVGQWLVTGNEMRLGTFQVWREDVLLWRRWLIAILFVGSVLLAYLARGQTKASMRVAICGGAIAINMVGYVYCWISYGGVNLGPGALNMATIAFIVGIGLRTFDTAAVPIAAASLAGATVSFAFIPILNLAELITGHVGLGYSDATVRITHTVLNHSLNIALFFCITFVLSRHIDKALIEQQPRRAALVYVAISLCTAILMFTAATQRFWTDYYFLLGLFPLINAVFDFLSIGLTRYTLRLGLERFGLRTLAMSALDLILALVVFAGLLIFMIATIDLLNDLSGGQAIPLLGDSSVCRQMSEHFNSEHLADPTKANQNCVAPLADVLRSAPDQLFWFVAAFATTLLPTFLHFCLGCFALGPALLGQAARRQIVTWCETAQEDGLHKAAAAFTIATWITVTLCVIALVTKALASILLGSGGLVGDLLQNSLS